MFLICGPLYKEGDFIGLSDIRNKLIHGDRISNEFIKMLSEAESSLQYMIERILLTIMGYSVSNSDVSKLLLSQDRYRLNRTADEQMKFKAYIDKM